MFPVGEKIPIAVVCYGFGKGLFQNYCQWCVWKGIFSFPVVVDTSILWTAGLEAIPVDQYEAARVDGAGTWQQFWHITWPELQPTLALTLILSLLNAFKVFREAYLVAGRYPQQSIYLLQHLFNNWFLSLDLPRLAAAAVLVALVLLVVILGLLKWWDHCAKDE